MCDGQTDDTLLKLAEMECDENHYVQLTELSKKVKDIVFILHSVELHELSCTNVQKNIQQSCRW